LNQSDYHWSLLFTDYGVTGARWCIARAIHSPDSLGSMVWQPFHGVLKSGKEMVKFW
jgi:hypothetical protein